VRFRAPLHMGYKRMKKSIYKSVSKLFSWLHPDIGVRLAQYLSVKNKLISGDEDITFLGEDKEWLILYSKKKTRNQTITSFFWTPSSTYESFCW
jgi:UDP-2,3-diacylglucosamine hydrolase